MLAQSMGGGSGGGGGRGGGGMLGGDMRRAVQSLQSVPRAHAAGTPYKLVTEPAPPSSHRPLAAAPSQES